MQLKNLNLRVPALIAALAIVLAACSANAGGGDGEPTLDIVTPAGGAEVEQGFEIQAESNVPLGPPETGDHHLHFYFDTDISSADYQLVYADSAPVERALSAGEHTIIVSLRNADHSDAGPMEEITVDVAEVSGDAGAGDAPASAAPAGDDGGLFDY